jgi:hypothetical protein
MNLFPEVIYFRDFAIISPFESIFEIKEIKTLKKIFE